MSTSCSWKGRGGSMNTFLMIVVWLLMMCMCTFLGLAVGYEAGLKKGMDSHDSGGDHRADGE